jgi:hypothetical protein
MSLTGERKSKVHRGAALLASFALLIGVLSIAGNQSFAQPSNFMEQNGADGNIQDGGAPNPPYDWANSGACTPLSQTQGSISCADGGGAFDGGVYNGATHPPTAPDAQPMPGDGIVPPGGQGFVADPLASDKTACGKGDPTVYTGTGGETNNEDLNTETYGTGSVPPKDEIENAYALAHIRSDGHTEVFFGSERVVNGGDSHVDFEFLQQGLATPTACAGTFQGNRAQGDLLITTDFTGGGTSANPKIYKWICRTLAAYAAADDKKICDPSPTGPDYDGTAGTGAAGANYSPHYEVLSNLETVNPADFPNTVNTQSINCGGWACRDSKGNRVDTLAANQFFEGGLDLTELGFNGCLSTFIPHTRSSQSFTATLKDFGGPIKFNTCFPPSAHTAVSSSTILLGDSITDHATLTGSAGTVEGTVDFFVCGPQPGTPVGCPQTATTASGPRSAVPGNPVTLSGGEADSGLFTPGIIGTYCFGLQYTHAPGSLYLDHYFDGATPPTELNSECFTVVTVPTTTHTDPVLSADGTNKITGEVPLNTNVYDRARITGTDAGGTPTGTVDFFICDPTQTTGAAGNEVCSAGTALAGNPRTATAIAGSSPPKSQATSSPAVVANKLGVWCFRAVYTPGGANGSHYRGSNDSTHGECFTVTTTPSATSAQNWLPNDTVTVGPAGGAALNGTLDITLRSDTCTGTVRYTEPTITLSNTAPGSQFVTHNSIFTVTTVNQGTYYWSIVFTPAAGSFEHGFTKCENSTLSIND